MAKKEIDFMEAYTTDNLAQAAYVTNAGDVQDQVYSEANSNGDGYILRYDATTNIRTAQVITAGLSGLLTTVKFFVRKTGTPTGNIFVNVYATSAGAPTGNSLATSSNVDASGVSGTAELVTFTFPLPILVTATGVYAISLEGDYALSTTNAIVIQQDYTSASYTGGISYKYDGTNWNANSANYDFLFYTYVAQLQSYSEATIKTQGSYALKAVATTGAINKTLTHTFASPLDLTGINTLKFDIRSTRTGANVKVGLHDTGGTTTELTPTINSADTYETKTWDISGVADADKNAIDTLIITPTNADAANTFYVDNFYYGSLGSVLFIGDC